MKHSVYAFAILFFPFLFGADAPDSKETQSLLWEISGNGLESPSYLYGTMHVGDKRAYRFSKSVMPSFNRCKAFAMEINPSEVNPMEMMEMMKLKEGTLQDLFTPAQWDSLSGFMLEKHHTELSTFNEFSPFFVYSVLSQSSFKNNKGQALDLYFFEEAKKGRKDLHGLETVEEQISAINTMTQEEQVNMLMDVMRGKDDSDPKFLKKMLKYYSKGDLDKLMEMSHDADMGEDFEAALINDRNYRMAERMEPLIKEKSTFVAVGALHLPGEEGVLELLRKQGYTVRALK